MTVTDQEQSPPPPETTAPPPAAPPSGWTAGRVIGLVCSSIGALIGIALLLGGLAVVAVHAFARDDDGFYTSGDEGLQSDAYAIVTEDIDLGTDPADWAPGDLATVRVRVESVDGGAVFAGIAPTADVDGYLGNVARSELTDFVDDTPRYEEQSGAAPAREPGAEQIWAAQSEGPGEQVVEWEVESGNWSVVVMNADASRGISVDADVGVEIGWLIWVGIGMAVVGGLLTALTVWLIVRIGRRASREPAAAT